MYNLERFSLDRLIEMAMADQMVEAFSFRDGALDLRVAGTPIRLSLPRARTFLIGMLRGRNWHATPDEGLRPSRRRHTASADRSPVVAVRRYDETTLDDLLAYANLIDLIEDYEKDPAAGTVHLHLWACTCALPYDDAVDFLADCIQDALLRMNETSGDVDVRGLMATRRATLGPAAAPGARGSFGR